MLARLQGWHLVIIVVLAVLLFAAPKLPAIARQLGQSLRIFRSEIREMKDEERTEAHRPVLDGAGEPGAAPGGGPTVRSEAPHDGPAPAAGETVHRP